MHVKKGDLVVIISGPERKLPAAKVLSVDPAAGTVIVEGRNVRKRHVRANPTLGSEGGILERERKIPASKVAVYSEVLKRGVRTQKRWVGANDELFATEASAVASLGGGRARKIRFCIKTGERFE